MVAAIPLFFNPAPDILLTQERVILMPDPISDNLYVEGKLDGFERNLLLQLTGKLHVQPFVCEGDICDFETGGKSVRIIRSVAALSHACDTPKDIVLTRYYLDTRCPGGTVIDRHDIEDKEGALVWIGAGVTTRFGRENKAKRPWQQNSVKHVWYSKQKFVK